MRQCKFDDPKLAFGSELIVYDQAPDVERVTLYDQVHFLTYARIRSAERAGNDWQDGARAILRLSVELDPEAARRCWESHSARARWLVATPVIDRTS